MRLHGSQKRIAIILLPIFDKLQFVVSISSPTYKKVVSQFLAGNFYCKFGIYNAKSIFCQNIVPLGQLEAEILIDLCSIKRSYFPDPIKRSYVTEWSVLCTYTTTIFLWVYYTKKFISKHLASVHHNSSTLKGLFLRFYGSDPRSYDILKYHKFIRKRTFENVFWLSWKVVLFEIRPFYM